VKLRCDSVYGESRQADRAVASPRQACKAAGVPVVPLRSARPSSPTSRPTSQAVSRHVRQQRARTSWFPVPGRPACHRAESQWQAQGTKECGAGQASKAREAKDMAPPRHTVPLWLSAVTSRRTRRCRQRTGDRDSCIHPNIQHDRRAFSASNHQATANEHGAMSTPLERSLRSTGS